jgi:hypothetical protein
MTEQRQKMRGTTAQLDAYIGLLGQITYDYERKELRLYDGVTLGGTRVPNFATVDAALPGRLSVDGGAIADCNLAVAPGFYRTTAASTNQAVAATQASLIVSTSHLASDGDVVQLWIHGGTSNQVWQRNRKDTVWSAWTRIPDSASGVAFNASNLNGQPDTFYTNIVARLGYTPVNKAGDTITGNLVYNDGTIQYRIALVSAGAMYRGTFTNHVVNEQINNVVVGSWTSTGLNSAAIGQTTAAAGNFVPLTQSGVNVAQQTKPCGRLSLTTGVPVTIPDTTGGTLYYIPYKGNTVSLYTSGVWKPYIFTERAITLVGLASDKNYDVFLYDSAGTLTLELIQWTNDTTRATALVLQDGMYVKTGATDRLYLGTIRTVSLGNAEDGQQRRYVWNMYNRVPRFMKAPLETADSWAYTTAAFRQKNANAANCLKFIKGVDEDATSAAASAIRSNSSDFVLSYNGIGLDSSTVNVPECLPGFVRSYATGSIITQAWAHYNGMPGFGYHELRELEYSVATGVCTWYGDAGTASNLEQSGITGMMLA